LALTFGGVALAMLGTLAMFGFWFADPGARSRAKNPQRTGRKLGALR